MADEFVPVHIQHLTTVQKRLVDMGTYHAEAVYNVGAGGGGGGGGGGAVTIANGDDVAEGSVGDAAYTGTGSGTVISLLKGIFGKLAQVVNVSGRLNVDVLTDVTQGTTADAAYTGSGSAGVIAILKGLYAKLAGTLTATVTGTVNAVITNPGAISVTVSNLLNPQPVSEADGANVALGTRTDGTWNSTSPANAGTLVSLLKTLFYLFNDRIKLASTSGYAWVTGSGLIEVLAKPSTFTILYTGLAAGDSVTTTPVQALNNNVILSAGGFLLKADAANTGDIWISHTSGSSNGFPLSAGEAIFMAVNSTSQIYLRSSAGTQKIYWMAGSA